MHESHALVLAGNDEPSAEMVRGVAAVLIPAGWVVSYHTERLSGPLSAGYLGSFDAVFAADIASDATRRALRKCKRIIGLRMDLTSAGLSSVLVDDEEVGRVAAEHLMGNGLRNLTGFALGRTAFADQRFASASRTVAVAGLNWLPTFVLSGGDFGRIDTWLDCLPKGTGVIAGCDEWGRVLIQRAREKGYLIPEQLQVIGVDNFSLACEVAAVPLSSVSVPWRELGRHAGMLLLGEVANPAPVPQRIAVRPNGVIMRRSSSMPHAEHPLIAQALQIIMQSVDRPISVPEILSRVPASRRELEKAFKRTVGRTIMQEVRRVHVEQAKRLLTMTELNVAEVAKRSGFPSAEKLCVNFRKVTGMSPNQYRKSQAGG